MLSPTSRGHSMETRSDGRFDPAAPGNPSRALARLVTVACLSVSSTLLPGRAPGQRADGPAAGAHRVRLAYFVPRDRNPVANYQARIPVGRGIVADLYLQDLRGKGYQTEGIRFESESSGPIVQLVRGDREASYYNSAPGYEANEQWRRLGPEIRAKVANPQRQVTVVFAETYDEGPAEHLWPGVIARGAYFNA